MRRYGLTRRQAARLTDKWRRLVHTRRQAGKAPMSTAEHIVRFEQQRAVAPYAGRTGRDASRYAYGGVRMCPCPGETRAPSMITYDPEDPYFGEKDQARRRDAASGYDVVRYSSGKSFVAPSSGRPDFSNRREASRAAEQANEEWARQGRPTLSQEMSHFFSSPTRDARKGGNTRNTKSKKHRFGTKRVGGRPGRYWESGAAERRERKRLARLKKHKRT